jgi:hypothetical protein
MPTNNIAGISPTNCFANGILAPNKTAAASTASTGGEKSSLDMFMSCNFGLSTHYM